MKTERLEYLDSLRGWAILLVLICHAGGLVNGAINQVTGEGNKGVELFYVLSAFMLFWTHYNKHRHEHRETLNFFVRRFFRIAPLFYPVVIVCATVAYFHRDGSGPTIGHLAATLLFVNGWNPAWINSIVRVEWSVAVEMTFYLIMPWLLHYVTNGERAVIVCMLGLLLGDGLSNLLDTHVNLTQYGYGWYTAFWFPAHLPVFLLGICTFFFSRSNFTERQGLVFTTLGVFVLVSAYFGDQVWVIRHHIVFAIGFCLIILGLGARPVRFFVNRPMTWLGKISFSVYLLHLPIVGGVYRFVVNHLGLDGWWNFSITLTAAIALVVPAAALSYFLIERPGIKLGSRVVRMIESRRSRIGATLDA
ncbi:acyltransferase family protein [Paraburkholderia tropica]|uniref:acyltransferase family protein n=1 Tax=Paraburkholderia tropica TaxID=92647 RepID=UPI002AB71E9F|nr:acyltransferase [Paraburkholderia tropica]